MNEKIKSILRSFFGLKKKIHKTKPVVLWQYSQSHVLQQRMNETKLTHGETIKGNVGPVRLISHVDKMVMYFCPLQYIQVVERISSGDGGSIPGEAILKEFDSCIPASTKPGLYILKNVILFSNGTIQVIADKDTKLEAI